MNIKYIPLPPGPPLSCSLYTLLTFHRVRTLTGKEIELDIEPDYKVRLSSIIYYLATAQMEVSLVEN